MTQRGIVYELHDTHVVVKVAKTSMCGDNCASCKSTCTPTAQLVQAVNETNEALSVGDTVLLETKTSTVIANAALVYVLPLACFFIAYFIAASLMQNEATNAIIAVFAALLSFVFVRIREDNLKKNNTFLVRITERLRKSGE